MNRIFAFIACLTTAGSPAWSSIVPSKVEPTSLVCSYETNCIVQRGETLNRCSDREYSLTINVLADGETAKVTKPNGSIEIGTAQVFAKFSDLPYLVFTTGSGVGTSMISVFPDNSSIWTGHFTLADNVSNSSFGTCEVLN